MTRRRLRPICLILYPLTGSRSGERLPVAPHEAISPTFCLTDLASYTRLMDEHGEAMISALQRHSQIIEAAVQRHNGRILERSGDSYLLVFERDNPLPCLLEIQHQFAQQDWGKVGSLRLKVGLHYLRADQEGRDFLDGKTNTLVSP